MTSHEREQTGIRLADWVREWDRDWLNLNRGSPPSQASSLATENPFQARPLTILDYMRTLWKYKFRKYSNFDPALDFDGWLETWLANFDEDDRRLAFTLASRTLFLSEVELNYLMTHVYRRVMEVADVFEPVNSLFIDLDGGIDLPKFFNLNQLQGYKDVRGDGERLFVAPERLLEPVKDLERAKSAESDLRAAVSFPEACRDYLLDLLLSHQEEVKRAIVDAGLRFGARSLFLLVDFIGSGGTAEHDLRRILAHYSFERVFFVPLVATADALALLQPLTTTYSSLRIVTGLEITRHHKVLSDICTLFTPTEKLAIKTLCEKYHSRLSGHADIMKHGDSIKYGFGDCQLLFVRQRNTPNNSLPLLWAGCHAWVPLFLRQSSYIRHCLKGAL